MPIAPQVAEILNEPGKKIQATLDTLRGMNVPGTFETPADATAALQHLLTQYITSLQRAVTLIANEVDRLAETHTT